MNNNEGITRITKDECLALEGIHAVAKNSSSPMVSGYNPSGKSAEFLITKLNGKSSEAKRELTSEFNKKVFNSLNPNVKNSLTLSMTPYEYVDFNRIIEPIIVSYPTVAILSQDGREYVNYTTSEDDFVTPEFTPEMAFKDQYSFFEESASTSSDDLRGLISPQSDLSDTNFTGADFDLTRETRPHVMIGYKASQNYMEMQRNNSSPFNIKLIETRQKIMMQRQAQIKAKALLSGSSKIEGLISNTSFTVNTDNIMTQSPSTMTFDQLMTFAERLRSLSIINQSELTRDTLLIGDDVYSVLKSKKIDTADIIFRPQSYLGSSYLAAFLNVLGSSIKVIPLTQLDAVNNTNRPRILYYNKSSVIRQTAIDNLMIAEIPMFTTGNFNQTRYFLNQFSGLIVTRKTYQLDIISTVI